MSVAIVIVALGVIGVAIHAACGWDRDRNEFDSTDGVVGMRSLLVGLAATSLLIMMLALLGIFTSEALVASAAILVLAAGWRTVRTRISLRPIIAALRQSLATWLTVAAMAATLAWVLPPFDATLASGDASVYLATANHVAEFGGLSAIDPLVAQMTPEEVDAFFRSRFGGDSTNTYIRFPGGVQLIDPATGRVGFFFYHLWPVWLALGLLTLGSPGFLGPLSVLAAVGVAAGFMVARQLAGRGFALATTLMLAASFPQTFYMRMPLSEMPAQAFFLAGLFAFSMAIGRTGTDRRNWQLLAAALWGAFCLTRADGVLFLLPALFLALLVCGDLRRSSVQWLPLVSGVVYFAALAFLHQVAGGVYAAVLGRIPRIGPALVALGGAVRDFEAILEIVWLVLGTIALAVGRRGLSLRAQRIAMAIAMAALALVSLVWIVRFVPRIDGGDLLRHLRWIGVYLPAWLGIGIAAGLAMLALAIARQPSQMRLTVALLPFLLVPLVSFVIHPYVGPSQPWAIRRLVPMALPLLFIFALLGWHISLSALATRFGVYFRHAYAVLAAGAIAYLLTASSFLWWQPLLHDVRAQVSQLAQDIPEGALVIVPDADAWAHLQVALQYGERRSVLMLPFTSAPDDKQESLRIAYLRRQVATGRPVIALMHAAPPFPDLLVVHFALERLFAAPIAFSIPLQAPELVFPRQVGTVVANYVAFRVRERGSLPIPARVAIGRPAEDIPFIVAGFHGAEGDQATTGATFRWTTGEAKLVVPAARSVRIFLHRARPASAPPLQLAVTVDGLPVTHRQFAESEHDVIEFALPESSSEHRHAFQVTLRSNPFSMSKLGLSADPRELSFAMFRLEFVE